MPFEEELSQEDISFVEAGVQSHSPNGFIHKMRKRSPALQKFYLENVYSLEMANVYRHVRQIFSAKEDDLSIIFGQIFQDLIHPARLEEKEFDRKDTMLNEVLDILQIFFKHQFASVRRHDQAIITVIKQLTLKNQITATNIIIRAAFAKEDNHEPFLALIQNIPEMSVQLPCLYQLSNKNITPTTSNEGAFIDDFSANSDLLDTDDGFTSLLGSGNEESSDESILTHDSCLSSNNLAQGLEDPPWLQLNRTQTQSKITDSNDQLPNALHFSTIRIIQTEETPLTSSFRFDR